MVVMDGDGQQPTVAHVRKHAELRRCMGLSVHVVIGTISVHIAVKMQFLISRSPCAVPVKTRVGIGASVLEALWVTQCMCTTPLSAGIVAAAATISNMASVRYACGNGCVRRAAHPRRSAKRAQALPSASHAQHLHPPIWHPMISCTCAPSGRRISAGVGLRVYVDFDAIETFMKAFNFDSRTSTMRMGMTLAVTWLTHLWTLRLSHHTWTLRNSRHWKSDAYVHSRDAAVTRRTCVRSHGQNRQTREGCVVCASIILRAIVVR